MINPTSTSVKLALEVLIQGLEADPDYAMQWVHALAGQVKAAGLPESLAYKAAAEFMWQNLRTYTFAHPEFPHCEDALRKAAGVLEGLGWEYRAEAWRAPLEANPADTGPSETGVVQVGFDLATGSDTSATTFVSTEEKAVLTVEHSQFDEKRMDDIGQNGNGGEHYTDAAAKAPVTFKALADTVEAPPPALRRSADPKPKPEVIMPNTTGMVDPTGLPRWADIPAWVKWLGQDRNGVWTGFVHKPEPRAGRWFTTKRYIELNSGEPAFAQDYTETLEERP